MQTHVIPLELIPYFEAIVDESKEKWITTLYTQKIIPYIDRLIRIDTFENRNITLHELSLLKSYFTKNRQSVPRSQRDILIHLSNGIKICDTLASDIEYSFFINVVKRKPGFALNSFLPDTFKRHLRSILEVQLLLFIESALTQIKNEVNESKRLELYHWVRKELNLKKAINAREYSSNIDFSQVGPSQVYYFFNGAQHLFILCQLEYIQLKVVVQEWLKWKDIFRKERLSASDLITLLTVPSAKFLFYVFCLSLLPYRILRTIVNQLCNYCTAKLQEHLLRSFPYLAKTKVWTTFKIIFQMSLYIALILGAGLPLFPLPLVWIPELLLSKFILLIPLLYSVSSIAVGRIARLFGKSETSELKAPINLVEPPLILQKMLIPQPDLIKKAEIQPQTYPIDKEHSETRKIHSKLHLR